MARALTAVSAAAALTLVMIAAPTPARADPWWFLAGVVVGSTLAPAYGYPFGYHAGYAPVPATAPWGPPPRCQWTKVMQNGAWHHGRVCDEAVPAYAVRAAVPIVSK